MPEVHVVLSCCNVSEKMFIICGSSNVTFPSKGLRTEHDREMRLRSIMTSYNYRLEAPSKNIKSQAEAREMFPMELEAFLNNYTPLKKAIGKL